MPFIRLKGLPTKQLASLETKRLTKILQKSDNFLTKIPDLEPPDLTLPKAKVIRGPYAYMLFPDAENEKTDGELEARFKQPFEALAEHLSSAKRNNPRQLRMLAKWPVTHKKGNK